MKQGEIQPIKAVVGSATITSSAYDVRQIYRISGQVIVGAGANTAGTLQLQYSDDPFSSVNILPSGVVTGAVNWSNFGTAGTVTGAGVVSLLFSGLPFGDVGYKWLRAVYTDTSGGTGAGTITVNLSTQGF